MVNKLININNLKFIGNNLKRPECVLVDKEETLHVADWRGGITLIYKNGFQKTILAKGNFKPKPNGIAILPGGGWLITHLGDNDGGVYKLSVKGILTPYLLEIDGKPLPPTNYVHIDGIGRVWITVSTCLIPRILGCKANIKDGFIILVDEDKPRIVAEKLGFTNECLIHPITGELYVNETFSKCLSKFKVSSNGNLYDKKIVTNFGFGEFPDGFAFDVEGGVWVTCIVSNKVIRISSSGEKEEILKDNDINHVQYVEEAYQKGVLDRIHLDTIKSKKLKNISSVAFGGSDLKNVFLGCLLGDTIATFKSEIAGIEPAHWNPKPLINKNYYRYQ